MNYGLTLPNADARTLADLASDADGAGWDGVFLWDTILGADAWVALAAMAMRTRRVRLGTMLTPLSRRRPWHVASEVATLDRLSGGRAILPVGLGAAGMGHEHDEFVRVGEETDRKRRADLLDESIDIITGLWSGQPFSYDGARYHLTDAALEITPIQTPRVPIWVVGAWPRVKSMRRVLRCDGLMPMVMRPGGASADVTPDDLRAMRDFVARERKLTTPFDIVVEGETPGDDPARAEEQLRPLAEAGVTWWLENVWNTPRDQGGVEGMRARIRQGPPPPIA